MARLSFRLAARSVIKLDEIGKVACTFFCML